MAFVTGTATDFADFYNKLRDFLTTNATLVADGEAWTQIAGSVDPLVAGDEIVLQGPGAGGTDEILVGIKTYTSVGGDYYNLGFYGLTTFNPAFDVVGQTGRATVRVLTLWNSPMDYWFIANGRRFIAVARVSTTYHMVYAGFVLPYVLPTQWPYPFFIAGSGTDIVGRYSDTGDAVRNPFSPGQRTASCCMPDNRWLEFWNAAISTGSVGDGSGDSWTQSVRQVVPWASDAAPIRDNIDGTYTLQQGALASTSPYATQLAALDGVFFVTGFSNAAENIITYGGVDHLVVPNVYRSGVHDFCAIALE